MAIPNNAFSTLTRFRAPIQVELPLSYEGDWSQDGKIVEGRSVIRTRSLEIPDVDSRAWKGENTSEEETFETELEQDTVYSFILVNALYIAPCFNLTIRAPNQRNTIVADRDHFSPQFPEERKTLAFDFEKFLRPNESINTNTWTVTVDKGTDSQPESILQGPPQIVGTEVRRQIGNGNLGTQYRIECEITTTENNVHKLVGFLLLRDIE